MKKLLLILAISLVMCGSTWSQCVPSCSVYVVTPITFTTFSGLGGPNGYGAGETLGDDQLSGVIPIGFNFQFYCNTYNSIKISSNGFITFEITSANSACCSGVAIPNASSPNDYIALGWNDWYPPGAGSISYTTTGVAPNRMFIVTYTNIPHCCSSGPPDNSGQIVLYETSNNIEIYSANITNDGSTCTQGIENSTGLLGLAAPGRSGSVWTATNSAYRWFAGGSPTPVTSIVGTATVCQGTTQGFTATTMPQANSYNWSLPAGWVGSSTTTAITGTAGATGVLTVSATYTCGTSAPTMFTVTTISAPVVTALTVTPGLICAGESVTVTGSAAGATNYTLVPTGQTGMGPFIVTPGTSALYQILAENAAGCVSFNSPVVTVNVKQTPTVTVSSGSICLGEAFSLAPVGATNYTLTSVFSQVTPVSAGTHTYAVIGTNSTGCVSTPVISTVVVNPLPVLNASATKPTICIKESTTLQVSGATTYSWNPGGAGSTLTVNPVAPTVYVVTGTAAGCSGTASVTVQVVSCTGIDKNSDNSSSIIVYPNPSNGEYTITSPTEGTATVYDMVGKVILEKKLIEGNTKISLSQFAAGKYLLKTTNGEKQQSTVLIKQ